MHSFARHQHGQSGAALGRGTQGQILNWGWRYDLMVWFVDTFLARGKLRELRRRTLELAQLQPGDKALDVGCGTGTLAIETQPRVGASGLVYGIDPGTQQVTRARWKAARRRLPVDFQVGVIEQLPFPDQTFDAVLSTIMMHHLPDDLKRRGLAEAARVLKVGGRLVVADFMRPEEHHSRPARPGAGDGGFQELLVLIKEAGFSQMQTQEMRLPRFPHLPGSGIGFVRAVRAR
jgi:ubiquinone/menaquinone biosynthesis C-methylase UbiE